MASVCDIYSQGVKKTLNNYWAAWMPAVHFEVGDVGVLNGCVFQRLTSLTALGIPFKVKPDNSPAALGLVSDSGVSIAFKAAGTANNAFPSIPKASAGFRIDFAHEGAFVVQCPETYEPEIDDPLTLEKAVIAAYESNTGKWEGNWVVITRIVTAPVGTILVSESASAGMEVSVNANLTNLADLAKLGGKLSVKSQTGSILTCMGAKDITPFFQLAKVKNRLFGPSVLKTWEFLAPTAAVTPPPSAAVVSFPYFDVVRDNEVPPTQP